MSATRPSRRDGSVSPCYQLGGLVLQSALDLPDLEEVTARPPDCLVELEPDPLPPPAPGSCFHQERPGGGEVWLEYARIASGYRMRFPGVADFLLLERGRRVRCHPQPRISAAALRHLLVQQVVPRLLTWRGNLVLHASAVGVGEAAVGFAGASGAGKSTLAAAFVRSGSTLLTDDMLVIETAAGRASVAHGHPVLRLWPDALGATLGPPERAAPEERQEVKTTIRASPPEAGPLAAQWPLRGLFLLVPGASDDEVEIDPVRAVDALPELHGAAFHLDVTDPSALRREFELWSRVLRDVPVFRLTAPRSLDHLPATRERILERLRLAGG